MKSTTYLSVLVSLLVLFVAAPLVWAQADPHQQGHAAQVETAGQPSMPCAKMDAAPCPHCPMMKEGGTPCPNCPHCPKTKDGEMPCPHCPKMTGYPCPHHAAKGRADAMPCQPSMDGSSSGMMHHPMMGGMMMEKMDREFFLDRKEALNLTPEQVARLEEIRATCRQDNMKRMNDVRSAHQQLAELMQGNWSLDEAEKLVRKSKKVEADMMVRHLEAKKAAEDVLTADQLENARRAPGKEDLEDLFR